MAPTETPLVPDVDGLCSVRSHAAEPTLFRCRVWAAERVALVEDAPANAGMSVTNAIEHIGTFLEAQLGVRFARGLDGSEWDGWQLMQHNPKARVHRFDLVVFGARQNVSGALALPVWSPLPLGLMDWLRASVVSAS